MWFRFFEALLHRLNKNKFLIKLFLLVRQIKYIITSFKQEYMINRIILVCSSVF